MTKRIPRTGISKEVLYNLIGNEDLAKKVIVYLFTKTKRLEARIEELEALLHMEPEYK